LIAYALIAPRYFGTDVAWAFVGIFFLSVIPGIPLAGAAAWSSNRRKCIGGRSPASHPQGSNESPPASASKERANPRAREESRLPEPSVSATYERIDDRIVGTTAGLAPLTGFELQASGPSSIQSASLANVLDYIVEYLIKSGAAAKAGETISYGYWLLRFAESDVEGTLKLQERRSDGDGYIDGCALAIRYLEDQHEVCHEAGSGFSPPRPDQRATVDPGVGAGLPVRGTRRRATAQDSGWDVRSSMEGQAFAEHLFHLTHERPDLVRFLALETGFTFDSATGRVSRTSD
jgi:hypothetical protein